MCLGASPCFETQWRGERRRAVADIGGAGSVDGHPLTDAEPDSQ